MIATGRELGDVDVKLVFWKDKQRYDALGIAGKLGHTKIEEMLRRYRMDRETTRREIRLELGMEVE